MAMLITFVEMAGLFALVLGVTIHRINRVIEE